MYICLGYMYICIYVWGGHVYMFGAAIHRHTIRKSEHLYYNEFCTIRLSQRCFFIIFIANKFRIMLILLTGLVQVLEIHDQAIHLHQYFLIEQLFLNNKTICMLELCLFFAYISSFELIFYLCEPRNFFRFTQKF